MNFSLSFPWYVAHRDTAVIVAGFMDLGAARLFCRAVSHGEYVIRSSDSVAAMQEVAA